MATINEVKNTIQKELDANEGRVYIFVNRQILEDAVSVLGSIDKQEPVKKTTTTRRTKKN